jgi:hypothetical protein
MPSIIDDSATVEAMDHQSDTMSTYTTTLPCPTLPRQSSRLRNFLETLVASCLRRRPLESRRISPEQLRLETPVDILARRHTYLYIRSLSG